MFIAPAKAWFMIFRVQAVLVWAVMSVTLSAALAYLDMGQIHWTNFFLTMAIASVVQGYPAHIVNEIIDWQSGADRVRKLGEKSGGSKVIKAGLATVPQLWRMFVITSILSFALMGYLLFRTNPQILWFFVTGYLVCIFYTLPPFRLAYRPFAGEWLGGFTGIMLNMSGAYFIQTGHVNERILTFSFAIGLVYIAIMILFHYLDYENDQKAVPKKMTTIVFLGLTNSKRYLIVILSVSAVIALMMGIYMHSIFYLFAIHNVFQIVFQARCKPFSSESIVRTGKTVTLGLMAFTLIFAGVIYPWFCTIIILVFLSFYLHKKFGKLKLESV